MRLKYWLGGLLKILQYICQILLVKFVCQKSCWACAGFRGLRTTRHLIFLRHL